MAGKKKQILTRHARKGTAKAAKKNPLVFALNGKIVKIAQAAVDPTMTLNQYLRQHAALKGTKLVCGEGGCGACTVLLSGEQGGVVTHATVNSCIRPLVTCHGKNVTTIEGLGSKADGYHPIQKRLAQFNGTQCGFCSPGMVMTMYGNLKATGGEGGKNTSMSQVEGFLDGNLCRCTGYRPILDAFKSLAKDSNVTDQVCGDAELGPYDESNDPAFPEALSKFKQKHLQFKSPEGVRYIRPTSVAMAHACYWHWSKHGNTRLVAGNTSMGVYKHQQAATLIDLALLKIRGITVKDYGLHVGAMTTLAELIAALNAEAAKSTSFAPLVEHITKIANTHVRNSATVGGNLKMAKSMGFKSDLAPILAAAGAVVNYRRGAKGEKVEGEELAAWLQCSGQRVDDVVILTSIVIPFLGSDGDLFMSYKVANRPQNSEAYVNSAFHLCVDAGIVTRARICFGGITEEDVPQSASCRATKTEQFLLGKGLDNSTLAGAIATVQDEMSPVAHSDWDEGVHNVAGNQHYRRTLLASMMLKFFVHCAGKLGTEIAPEIASAGVRFQRPVSRGTQAFVASDEKGPIYQPIRKVEGRLQCSGELPFVDDVPNVEGTLHGAYIHAPVAKGDVRGLDISIAEAMPGVELVLLPKHIIGENALGMPAMGVPDIQLLATDKITYHGQALGLVVATSPELARRAAAAVLVDVATQEPTLSLKPFVASEEAMATLGAEYRTPVKNEVKCGDALGTFEKGEHTVEGTVELGTQKHFYLETQTCYTVPQEDGTFLVNASIQGPDVCATAIQRVTGLSLNRIEVVHRRSGGSFGGKLVQAMFHACCVTLASMILRRPVRVCLSRAEDFMLTGGREETYSNYKAACDKEGKISAVVHRTYMNGGRGFDAVFMPFLFGRSFHEVYHLPNFDGLVNLVRLNTCNRTFVRGPGELSASVCMETILEHIAHDLNLDPVLVRERNFYAEDDEDKKGPLGNPLSLWTVHELWNKVKVKADYDNRKKQIEAFNAANRWRKQGISITPVNYSVSVGAKQAAVSLFVDGTVLLTTGGTEMGQGLNTKAAQVAAHTLGALLGSALPMDAFRVAHTSAFVTPHAGVTGGSTGSEAVCGAMTQACEQLVERLKPVLGRMREEAAKKAQEAAEKAAEEGGEGGEGAAADATEPEFTWKQVIAAANKDAVCLANTARYGGAGKNEQFGYNNYGACCSVVEVDTLTGETTILSSDLVYDCGKSLNPAIDVGQCEGAFIMGIGHLLREKEVMSKGGKVLSEGTWLYKIPSVLDIPVHFSIELLQNNTFERGVLSSKASGEPPLVLATSVLMAVRQAVKAARVQAGNTDFFDLPVPCTPDVLQNACLVSAAQLSM